MTQISFSQTPFSQGYAKGYSAGYCYEDISCIPPVPPIGPNPNPGYDSYQDGYNRGFSDGRAANSKSGAGSTRRSGGLNTELIGKAQAGTGQNTSDSSNFSQYNASNNYGIPPRAALPPGPRNSEYFTVKGLAKNANSVVLILNGYFNKSNVKSNLAAMGLFLIKKKYYAKENALDIDFKKLNKKEKKNLSIANVVCVRFDMIRYNSLSDYMYKIRIFDNENLYFDGDFENINSGEGLYNAIKAVNEVK